MQPIVPTAVPDLVQRPGAATSPSSVGAGSVLQSSTLLQRVLRLGIILALVLAMQGLAEWVSVQAQLELSARENAMFGAVALMLVLAYTVTMAVPFVPGIEIGLAIMVVFGPQVFLLVYACTQVALLLSFVAGRVVPLSRLAAVAGWLQFHGMQSWLGRLEPLAPEKRLEYMIRCAPRNWVQTLIAHRYLALVVFINLPGNAVIGGAGGIGLVAGMSRVFGFWRYVFVMALATTPVPIALWICYHI